MMNYEEDMDFHLMKINQKYSRDVTMADYEEKWKNMLLDTNIGCR